MGMGRGREREIMKTIGWSTTDSQSKLEIEMGGTNHSAFWGSKEVLRK